MEQEKNNLDADKILKYKGKYILIQNLILVVCIVISILLVNVTDSISLIFAINFGLLLVIGIVIDIVRRLWRKIVFKKYDIHEIKEELSNVKAKKLDGVETYLTENYIVCNEMLIRITKYADIEWAYLYIAYRSGTQYTPVNMSFNSKIKKYAIAAHLKNGIGDRVIIARVKNDKQLKEIYSRILKKRKKALKGYTEENIKKYEKINKIYRIENKFRFILAWGAIIISIIGGVIYAIFF